VRPGERSSGGLSCPLIRPLVQAAPSETCVDIIELRTRQAGWPDGSLWGLSDSSCDEVVAKGAEDTGSEWNALFACVQQKPFSTCVAHIPED
jgi:hypothetical protein